MSCIYKVSSKDITITESYIGKTQNVEKRWREHKSASKGKNICHIRLYDFINKNGGIDNWDFQILEAFEWEYEVARQKERFWYEKTQPKLNDKHPGLSKKESQDLSDLRNSESRDLQRHEHRVEKIICECGMTISRGSRTEHLKRGRHLKRITPSQ
jgi:predicted GIY-YIG superfamily endonuclease